MKHTLFTAAFLLLAALTLSGASCDDEEERLRREVEYARRRAEAVEADNRKIRQAVRRTARQHKQELAVESTRRSWSEAYAFVAAVALTAAIAVILHLRLRRAAKRSTPPATGRTGHA